MFFPNCASSGSPWPATIPRVSGRPVEIEFRTSIPDGAGGEAFLGVGWLLTIAAAFITPFAYASNLFLAGSVFLAFAYLNPDFVMMLFFILPVKIKWLALFTWVVYGYEFVTSGWSGRLQIIAALGNFLIFFGRDLVRDGISRRRSMARAADRVASTGRAAQARHRCHVCGKTNLTNPEMDFRYCSKCAGDQCYCPEHIFNHEHVLVESDGAKK